MQSDDTDYTTAEEPADMEDVQPPQGTASATEDDAMGDQTFRASDLRITTDDDTNDNASDTLAPVAGAKRRRREPSQELTMELRLRKTSVSKEGQPPFRKAYTAGKEKAKQMVSQYRCL
jgi:hypothetical protein